MRRHAWTGVAILICLCFALRVVQLGSKSLWIDEIWSLRIAKLPWHSFAAVIVGLEPNASLYYLLLHFWLLLGDSEVVLRLFSVLFATATIPIIYMLGKKLSGPGTGLIAAMLVAVNMFHIQWSQETRGYALLVFLLSWASLLFLKCVEAPTLLRWVLYSLICTAAVYVHLYAGLVVVAHWTSLSLLKPREIPWRRLILSGSLLAILSSPLVYLVYVRSKAPLFAADWLPRLSPYILYKSAHQMAGNPYYEGATGGNLLLVLAGILCLLAGMALVVRFLHHGRSIAVWHAGFALCWLVVPPALMYAESLIQPMFVYRYLLVSLPAMALTMTNGLLRIRPRWLSLAAALLIPLLSISGLLRYYQYRAAFSEWRTVAAKIATQAQPGDGVIYCVAPGRLLVDYYAARPRNPGSPAPQVLYPDFPGFDQDWRSLQYLPRWGDDQFLAATSRHPRVWLVLYHDFFKTTADARDHLKSLLSSQYQQVAVTRINGVTLDLYSRPSLSSDVIHPAPSGQDAINTAKLLCCINHPAAQEKKR